MTMKKYLDLFEAEQVSEKAVSQQQQKFMGMVHAMQKGEQVKGASPELKKVAKTMGKKDAADFAKTKHKDLPKRVTEDIMLDEGGNALKHIANRFKHEVKNFMNTGDMAENLYDALYDYYVDTGEMPYGVAKAREGQDPYAWVEERFYADIGSGMSENTTMSEVAADDSLNELARLAGLHENVPRNNEGMGDDISYGAGKFVGRVEKGAGELVDKFKQGRQAGNKLVSTDTTRAPSAADVTGLPSDENDPMFKSAGPRPKPSRDTGLNECGDMDMDHEDSFNVSTNMSSNGTRSVNISAQGSKADDLLQMLKMAGMRPHDDHARQPAMIVVSDNEEMMDEERETEYANTPEEEYETVAAITRQGNDLNREKKQFADKPKLGDNPMASDEILDEELSALLDSILVREREGGAGGIAAEQPYRDERSGRMIYPPRGATNPPQDPVSPAAKPPKEPPSIFDREKPYKDPKTGRMRTPPKGLSISEPVYPATKGSR